MRLGPFFLTAALALPAQVPGSLPWNAAPAVPWKSGERAPAPEPATAVATQTQRPLTVKVSADGALRIVDHRGLVHLRMGLSGRPLKLWRDWGVPVTDPFTPLPFPSNAPLRQGIGYLPIGSLDFRPALEGLLWILDDEEKRVTVIFPATSQVIYLPLPGGQNLTLVFHPERLEVLALPEAPGAPVEASSWSVPWLALLPHFIHLGVDSPSNRTKGTALIPYPKD